ncbi:hypothetical protein DYB32_005679 [Aphanomyces invadans]|uniref:Cilia- and flagella-associated protein 69 ARM repeats domain-containing protein n=1 Tax=Aphanomyces invadans TaxID=157072 RepID=A0A3R6V9T2_9STRA|nr:hypothetical protein DYB32_005679 [Aphanomyces invadans]
MVYVPRGMATVRNDTTGNAFVMKAKPPAPTDGPVVEDTGSAKDFQKILDTFQDKQTTELYSRQVALLQVLLQKFPTGPAHTSFGIVLMQLCRSNTTLMILDILASKSRNLPLFVESGLLATLLKYAEAADIAPPSSTSVAKASNFASSCEEDFEFKHMLWIVLADVAKGDLDAVRLISDSSFLHVLLLYVSPDQERSHDGQHFSPAQRQVLQVMALHVLSALVPRMPVLFVELHGHVVLLEFVQVREFRRADGVAVLSLHLHFEPAHAVSQDNLIVAVVSCIWSSVIGNAESELCLIQSEGVDNLLDLLEVCVPRIARMVLFAPEFPVFRVGEEWLNIKMALHAQNIRPIYADALLIEMKLEHVYSIVAQVRCSQQDIYAREESAKAKEEALFFAGVRHQKEQERQTTSKKVVAKSSMKAHLEAKKRKADMLRKSTVLDASSGDDRTDTSTTFVFTDPPPVFHDL